MKIIKREDGVTLIEVLLSLIVLAIGILGVLALFPSAIAANNATAQDVMAANLAASVEQALMVGMANAYWNSVYQTYQVTLSHDLLYMLQTYYSQPTSTVTLFTINSNTIYNGGLYQFLLPTIIYTANLAGLDVKLLPSVYAGGPGWHRHPGTKCANTNSTSTATVLISTGSSNLYNYGRVVTTAASISDWVTPIDPQSSPSFALCGDSWVSATINGVMNATMGYSEPYSQYQFSFDVIKLNRINASWYGPISSLGNLFTGNGSSAGSATSQDECSNKFYEFRIHIFRGAASGKAYKVRILTVPLKIAVKTLK